MQIIWSQYCFATKDIIAINIVQYNNNIIGHDRLISKIFITYIKKDNFSVVLKNLIKTYEQHSGKQ